MKSWTLKLEPHLSFPSGLFKDTLPSNHAASMSLAHPGYDSDLKDFHSLFSWCFSWKETMLTFLQEKENKRKTRQNLGAVSPLVKEETVP